MGNVKSLVPCSVAPWPILLMHCSLGWTRLWFSSNAFSSKKQLMLLELSKKKLSRY